MEHNQRNLTPDEHAQAVILLYGKVGVSVGLVSDFECTIQSFHITKIPRKRDPARRPGQAWHRVTTAIQDRFLRISALWQPFLTHQSFQIQLQNEDATQVSYEIVRQWEVNLTHRIAARGTLLTVEHRRERLRITNEHVNWLKTVWDHMIFTDKS